MSDLFGFETPPRAFKDVRNQRPGVAQQKAELLLELGALIKVCPKAVANGSIQKVRQWRAKCEKARGVAGNPRSSVHDITRAIKSMRALER